MSQNNLLRVTQMNAILLDKEIYRVFEYIFHESVKYLPPGFLAPYEPEIKLIIRLGVLHSSIFKSGATFGQQLLSIEYESISKIERFLYIAAECAEYVKYRIEYWWPSHNINRTILKLEVLLKLFGIINFLAFLRHGTKPLLIDRILGLNLVYAHSKGARHFDSKYFAREVLWNSFIEILLFVLPLINYHKIRRIVKSQLPFVKRTAASAINKDPSISMHTLCAYCKQHPILPHHMGCPHIFCYICLKGNLEADSRFQCPICDHSNPNALCERVYGN